MSMQFLFKSQVYSSVNAWKNVFLTLHVLRNRWFTNSFKTDKKTFAADYWSKLIYYYKTLALGTARLFISKNQSDHVVAKLLAYSRQRLRYMISRIILAALDRLFTILWTGTALLGLSEFVQDLGPISPIKFVRYILNCAYVVFWEVRTSVLSKHLKVFVRTKFSVSLKTSYF